MVLRLTRGEVRQVDELATLELGIPGIVLMENAGRGAAERILAAILDRRLAVPERGASVVILCGRGNNAGDGYVVARHLHCAGLRCRLAESYDPRELSPDAALFRRVTHAIGLEHARVRDADSLRALDADLLVDALLGTGFHGEPRPPLDMLIRAANARRLPTVALDCPSGLDVDSGTPARDCIRADLTLSFVAAKVGFSAPAARAQLGELEVVPIGAPPELIERVLAGRSG